MHTVVYVGVLHMEIQSGAFDENLMKNIDETYFIMNINNEIILEFIGDTTIFYVEIVLGVDFITMLMKISEGRRSMIEALMLIFTNENMNYHICGLDYTISGVCYMTVSKGWIYQIFFTKYFVKPRAFQSDIHGRPKIIWNNNYTGHNMTPQLSIGLEVKQTILRYSPPCVNTFVPTGRYFYNF